MSYAYKNRKKKAAKLLKRMKDSEMDEEIRAYKDEEEEKSSIIPVEKKKA